MTLEDLSGYQDCLKAEKNLHKKRRTELKKLTRFISSCSDPLVRSILIKRFIDGESWTSVAVKVGGNNTADNCRMIVSRYLEKLKSNNL